MLLCCTSFSSFSLLAQEKALDPLLRWMNQIAQQQLSKRESAIATISTIVEAERRKESVRGALLELMGGLPNYPGPLNARVTGSLKTKSYIIEKVILESLPGYFVTANLYRPNDPGRYPAVLLSAGHLQSAKTEPQRIAANLALKGFVAMTYDPVGQGERVQTFDRRLGGALAGWGTNEHINAGAQCFAHRPESGPLFYLGRTTSARLSGESARSRRYSPRLRRLLRRRRADYLRRCSRAEDQSRRARLFSQFFPPVVYRSRS